MRRGRGRWPRVTVSSARVADVADQECSAIEVGPNRTKDKVMDCTDDRDGDHEDHDDDGVIDVVVTRPCGSDPLISIPTA